MSLVQIFIATHNRPGLAMKAIESALNQNLDAFEVIVSDNSTNDETAEIIKKLDNKRLIYKRRIPALSSFDHFNAILHDVTSEFFIIFHDDDIMHENMVDVLVNRLKNNSSLIAAGANAFVSKRGKIQKRKFHNSLRKDILISSSEQMIEAYSKLAFVPFPGYLYKREVAEQLSINLEEGGKHCDVAFIINLLSLGNVTFVAEPLMDYYIHDSQDSSKYDFKALSQLISYIQKKYQYKRRDIIIRRMRIQNIYGEMKSDITNRRLKVCSKRYYTLIMILMKYSASDYFIKIVLITLVRILKKGNSIKI